MAFPISTSTQTGLQSDVNIVSASLAHLLAVALLRSLVFPILYLQLCVQLSACRLSESQSLHFVVHQDLVLLIMKNWSQVTRQEGNFIFPFLFHKHMYVFQVFKHTHCSVVDNN